MSAECSDVRRHAAKMFCLSDGDGGVVTCSRIEYMSRQNSGDRPASKPLLSFKWQRKELLQSVDLVKKSATDPSPTPNINPSLRQRAWPEPRGSSGRRAPGSFPIDLKRDLLDITPSLTEAAGAIVDDSFTRCFKSNPPEPWNWNAYLFPLWCFGVVVRYLILFPLRATVLAIGWIVFLSSFIPVHFLLKGHGTLRKKIEVQGRSIVVPLVDNFLIICFNLQSTLKRPAPAN
ncbi:hypothetical protein CRG98_048511, partial [Punica granatum]